MATTTEEVKIRFSAETNTQSFKNLQNELDKIQNAWAQLNRKSSNPMAKQMQEAATQASKLETAMAAAFNPKLNTYNLDTLKQKLQASGTSLNQVVNSFNAIGYSGQSAILSTVNSLTSMNLQLDKSKTLIDKMGEGLIKTAGWSVASSVINNFSSGIQNAYGYVKALDSSLNDIRIVTGKSADEMDRFAETANKAAITLGKGTKDYTDAALIYYQQGLSDSEVQARTDITLKTASVTQQSTQAVSEELTAIWNGYKVQADEAELYIDKVAAVAATTAADLEELATGMSKVASAANSLGVDIDQMNAMLATTVSVTRQSPETVGVAYKTILARMSALESGGTDEEGVTLGKYTEKMAAMGFNVLDETGHLKQMGQVIEEIGEKWADLSTEQQIALAQVAAGTRQYNNLIALFDNWDMYKEALQTSANAAGTLNEQQDIFMESTTAHLQQMRTAAEGVYDSLLSPETINKFADILTNVLQVVEKIVDGFGGIENIVVTIAPILTNLFSKQITGTITAGITNFQAQVSNKKQIAAAYNQINTLSQDNSFMMALGKGDAAQHFQQSMNLLAQGNSGLLDASQMERGLTILQTYSQDLFEISNGYKKLEAEQNVVNSSLKKLGASIKETDLSSDAYGQEIDDLIEYYKKLDEQIIHMKLPGKQIDIRNFMNTDGSLQAVNTIKNKINNDELIEKNAIAPELREEVVRRIQEAYNQLSKDGGNVVKVNERLITSLNGIGGDATSAVEKLQGLKQSYKDQSRAVLELDNRIEQYNKDLTAISYEGVINGAIKFTTSIANGVLVISNFKNALTTLNDSTKTFSQKISAFVPSLTSLLSLSFQFVPTIKVIKSAINDLNIIQKSNILQTNAQAIAEGTVTASTLLHEEAEKKLEKAQEQRELQQTALDKKDKAAAATHAQNAATLEAEAAAMQNGAKASKVLESILSLFTMAVNPVVATIAVVVAAIAAVGVALYKEYKKADKALENANKKFSELRQAASEAKEALNSFNTSTSSLESLQKELSKLTKGTEDWDNKLKEVQNTTESLIEQFPELRKYATWENGGWSIAKEDLEKFQKDLEKISSSAAISQSRGYIDQLSAERDIADRNMSWSGGSSLWFQSDHLYSDTIKSNQEIQEKINQAVEERNEADIKYWERVLSYKEKTLEIEKAQQELAKQMVDTIIGDRIDETIKGDTNEDHLLRDYNRYLAERNTSSKYQEAVEEAHIAYSRSQGPGGPSAVIENIRTAQSALTGVPKDLITVKATAEGFEVSYLQGTKTITDTYTETSYASLIGQYSSSLALEDFELETKEDVKNYARAMRSLYEEDSSVIDTYNISWLEDLGFQNEVDEKISAMRDKFSSSVGKMLLEEMSKDKKITLEDLDELSYAIQEVYAKKGPQALEVFLQKLREGKVEVTDFMDFDFDDASLANFSEEILERIKKLKIDEKTLDRYKIKLGLEIDDTLDDEAATKILNYIEAQTNLNKIYKDREEIFENLAKGDRSSDKWIENMTLLSNTINTYFGANAEDNELINYLDLIGKFLDGDQKAANKLGAALRGLSEGVDYQNDIDNFVNTINDISIGYEQYIDEDTFSLLEKFKEKLHLTDEDFDKTLANAGYIKDSEGYKKIVKTITEVTNATKFEIIDADKTDDDGNWIAHPEDNAARRLGYTDYNQAKEHGWELYFEGNRLYLRNETEIEQDIIFTSDMIYQSNLKEFAIGMIPGKDILEMVATATGKQYSSIEEFEHDWVEVGGGSGYRRFRQKYYFELSGETTNEIAAPGGDGASENTEIKYTKKVEWDTQETKYDYNAEAQKDIDRRLSELKEDFDKTTGEARNAIYEEEISLLEQKNGLLQESIDLKKQEIAEDQKDLDEIAKKYGVNIEYDEMGRVTQESAQALMDAVNGAGKAAADAQYSAQKAVDEADKDSKTRTQNALTQASENVADIKKDSQVVEKLFSELASDSNTIADATSKIKKNTEEAAQLKISKQWNETDSEIKKSTKDIEHINKVIANLDKESSHLDFEGRMENAREAWELQEEKAEKYKKQTEDIYETINKVLSPEQIKKSGINFADLLNMDPLEIEKMSMDVDEILEGLYSKPLEERTEADKEEIAAWESIKEHLNDASKAAEGYNEILDKTKVNTDKVKEATDQIETSKIDHNITKLNRELKTLKRAQSNLKGTALIDNLKQQLAVQQKIVQEEIKKLAIMKKQMVTNATALQQEKDWAKIGLQIQYNEDGSIANYYELLAAIRSCKDLDEKRREELEGQLEVINKQSDAYTKQYEAIQSAKDAAEDIAKEIKEKLKEELSKAFNAKVDVEVNIEDAWRNLHKLRAELDGLKDDDYFGNMNLQLKQLTEYLNTNPNSTLPGGSTQILTQHLQDIMSEIRTMQGGGTSKIYGTDQSAAFSDLQNYRDQLGSNVQSMMDSVKEMKQTYLSAIDAMISANDKFIQSIDKMSSILNNTMNIIKLVYGDDSYQKMDKYLRMSAQLAMNSATAARNNADNYRARMLSSTTEEEYRKWADAWTGAIDDVYSHMESAIKALSELAENNFKKIAASFTDQWKEIGENGLPLSISWEYEKTKVKDFYDYTNSMYQKDSLSRKIQKAIDEATDPTTINALQDAYANIIGYLDESIKKNKQLSKYEIERANKLYELTLKQMALEDERDNKTKMRLRRDQAGNYRYEYVADDNKVAQSEEDVEKAKNDLYNLAYNRAVSASDSINTYTEQMTKQLSEAAKMYNGDPEQLQAEFKKIYNKYNGLIKAAQNDIALSEQDLKKYGLENDSDFLNVLDHTQNFKSGLTEEQLDQIFGENVNYYEMMRALGVDTEQMAESDMATAQDISKYYQYYADKLADQVDQTKMIVDQLEAMEPMLKSLAETALATYQQSLYFREQDVAAIGADSTDANGSSGLNLVVSNRATAGGTLTYDYDPDSGRVFMRNEDRHNEAGRKKLEAMYGAENVRTDAEWSEYARENQVTIGGFTRQKRTDSYNESRNKNGVVESSAALAEAEAIKSANKRKEIYDKTVKIAAETAKKGGTTAGIFQELQGIGAMLAEPQPLEQHVQIDAQFQGKTKETEIFEALKGLVNRAAQIAENNGK